MLLAFRFRRGRAHGSLRLHGAGELCRVFLGGKCLIQLRHGLDALHGPQTQAKLQHLRNIQRQAAVNGLCPRVGVCDHTLCCRHRSLPAHHAVKHRCKAVFIGIAALELCSGVLFRGRIPLIELLVQAAPRCAQTHCGVARQTAAAVFHHPDVLRADAPVHQTDLVHCSHALKHRLQHRAGVVRTDGAGVVFQPLIQRGPARIFQHGIDGVVRFHHVQHRFQTVCRCDALDGVVQICKIHTGGLEQHLAAGLGAEHTADGTFCREGDWQVLFDGHPEAAQIFCAAVQDALTIDAEHFPYGVAPGQHRSHRQCAAGVASGKAFAAVRAALCSIGQRLQAVGAQACCFHSLFSLLNQ